MTTTAQPFETRIPVWSGRQYTEADRESVLSMFTEPDFFFRTAAPDTRPEWEIRTLVNEDTTVLLADGDPIGLYALDEIGGAHGCHYQLHLRLRGAAPLSWWCSAYEAVTWGLRWQREVVRLTLQVGEFDRRGLEVAHALGLQNEGTLADVVVHGGRRYGYVFFAQIWMPSS